MKKRIEILVAAAALAIAAMAFSPAASAYGPSYCNRSTCDLASAPYTWGIYFQMPRYTAETMICWTDTQYYMGSVRWFKVNTIYGIGYTPANEVSNQTSTPHC